MTSDVSVRVGGKDVVASGSLVLSVEDTEWSITLEDLAMHFRFVEDRESVITVRTSELGPLTGLVELVNWQGSMPTTYVMPQAFSIDGRVLTLGIAVQTITNGTNKNRIVTYSLKG